MGTDFAPFPLATGYQNDKETVISFRNPATPSSFPTWGKRCWWIDPPPPGCEPKLFQLDEPCCSKMSGGLDLFKDALVLDGNSSTIGKVVEGTDLGTFPPHLLPLIKVIDQIANEGGIDLKSQDFKGLTITLHK